MKSAPFQFPLSLLLAVAAQGMLLQLDLPWTLLPGLVLYLAAIVFFYREGGRANPTRTLPETLPLKTEWLFLAFLAAVILFFRLFRLLQVPAGMTVEETCGPWLGFALPASQWPPYFAGPNALAFPDVPRLAYPWFHLFAPSQLSFRLFYVSLSLLAFPLGYGFFRGLAGPPTALIALFLWGIMQWHVTSSRNGHTSITALFFIISTLWAARTAWNDKGQKYWVLAGAFCGAGLYGYPAFRPCLLYLAVILGYEWRVLGRLDLTRRRGLAVFCLCFLGVASPIWLSMIRDRWLVGPYFDAEWVQQSPGLSGFSILAHNFFESAMTFFRTGALSGMESVPGRRLLDDPTAILFVLGFFGGLGRLKERRYFYGVTGVLIFMLPMELSTSPTHATRMLGAIPFIALLAASAVLEIGSRVKRGSLTFRLLAAAGCVAAGLALGENFEAYFVDRPQNEICWETSGSAPTGVGQAIADGGDGYEYYLSPIFYQQLAVLFLGHGQQDHTHPLDVPDSFNPPVPAPGRGLLFALPEGRTGVLKILEELYPDGREENRLNPWGRPYLHFFRVPPESLGENKGLSVLAGAGVPSGRLPQFPSGLPSSPSPLHLRGSLWVEKEGDYRFRTKGGAEINALAPGADFPAIPIHWDRGFHPLDFNLQSKSGGKNFQIEESFNQGPFRPLDPENLIPHLFPKAWRGTYWISLYPLAKPVLNQSDLVLNFSYRGDFPVKNYWALRAQWRGTLHPRQPGSYGFLLLTGDHTAASLEIDGHRSQANQESKMILGAGPHPAVVRFEFPGGVLNSFHLLWKPPGAVSYEVLPPEALE